MENSNFNEQDSLKLISQMINTARGNLKKGAGKYFILWGYVIFIPSILVFVSYMTKFGLGGKIANNLWFIAYVLGAILTVYFIFKDRKKEIVKTYTDSIIGSIWIGFGISVFVLMIVFMYMQKGAYTYPSILFLYTYALFISSKVYKLKMMYLSVLVCALCTLSFIFIPFPYYPLSMAIAMLCGNIIPGHLLNKMANKQDV